MELGPIFRSLMHNKVRFWLIALEVAFTLAIVVNCVNMVLDLHGQYVEDTGQDEKNMLMVIVEPFDKQFEDDDFIDTVRAQDIARLRATPGVVEAIATSAIPLSGGGSGTGRRPVDAVDQEDGVGLGYFSVTEGAVAAFGTRLVAGRTFEASDFQFEPNEDGLVLERNVIVTKSLADKLFPDGNALGKVIQNDSGEARETIIGVVDRLQNFWPWSSVGWDTMLRAGEPGDSRSMRYLLRTEAGAIDAVAAGLEERMLEAEPGRLVTVRAVSEFKRRLYNDELALINILLVVTVLMILVTSLGIIGLTSFSVTERTRQIGTRRALGATKGDIVRYFLTENWLITGVGLFVGLILSLGLNYTLVQVAGMPKIDWKLLAGGMLLLWGSGILAALAPALRATSVAPEVATRTV
ncbi:MAG: FtsX-like permease family protein [Acidobacteriota bacterium]